MSYPPRGRGRRRRWPRGCAARPDCWRGCVAGAHRGGVAQVAPQEQPAGPQAVPVEVGVDVGDGDLRLGPLHVRLGAVAGAVAAVEGDAHQGAPDGLEVHSARQRETVRPDLLETQLVPPGDPPLGAEPGGVEAVDHLQAPAPPPDPARSLDAGLVPEGGDRRRLRLRAHRAEVVEGTVEVGEQAHGHVEVTGAEVEEVAEGALYVQLLQDHLAAFLHLLLELAEFLVLQLESASGPAVLELHLRFQLDLGQQFRLQLQGQPRDVHEGAVVASRAPGPALLVGAVVEAPVVEGVSPEADPQTGRRQRRAEAVNGERPVKHPVSGAIHLKCMQNI